MGPFVYVFFLNLNAIHQQTGELQLNLRAQTLR